MNIGPDISIRKAESGDIDRIKKILLDALSEYEIDVPDDYPLSDIDSIALGDSSFQIFVLLRDASVIGFISLRPITHDRLELKRMYLSGHERGKGLGCYLLENVIQFARRHGYQSIQLETTSKFYRAVSLYRKYGFSELENARKSPGHDLAFIKVL